MPGNPNPTAPPRKTRVDGVLVQDLSWYTDQRGSLSVLLRGDAEELLGGEFGQAYVTTILPDVVKAWHRHEQQWRRHWAGAQVGGHGAARRRHWHGAA